MNSIDWSKGHILYIANEVPKGSDIPDEKELRSVIEPWLTAVFQSEHLSLLLGSGLTTGICYDSGVTPQAMQRIKFTIEGEKIEFFANEEAKKMSRGSANFEDDLRMPSN